MGDLGMEGVNYVGLERGIKKNQVVHVPTP